MVYHLFYSQSWICQLVSESIIETNRIDPSHVVMLRNRNFAYQLAETPFRQITMPKLYTHSFTARWRLPFQLRRLRNWVNQVVGKNSFYLYIPHAVPLGLRWLCTHPQCISVSLIEEGTLSYLPETAAIDALKNDKLVSWPLNVLTGLQQILLASAIPANINATYGVSEQSFPFVPSAIRKNVFSVLKRIATTHAPNDHPASMSILATHPFIDILQWSSQDTRTAWANVARWLKENLKGKMYVKYHPSDSLSSKQLVREALQKEHLAFEELPNDFSLELAFWSTEVSLFCFESSAAVYASLAGQQVHILSNLVMKVKQPMNFARIDFSSRYVKGEHG